MIQFALAGTGLAPFDPWMDNVDDLERCLHGPELRFSCGWNTILEAWRGEGECLSPLAHAWLSRAHSETSGQ